MSFFMNLHSLLLQITPSPYHLSIPLLPGYHPPCNCLNIRLFLPLQHQIPTLLQLHLIMCQTCHQMSQSLYPILHIPYHLVHALLPLGFTKWLRVFTDGRVKYPISRALLAVTVSALEEPTCYSNVIKLPEWRQAMQAEFNALLQNQTWTFVPPQNATNLVGCK
jgi:hypothetical protein